MSVRKDKKKDPVSFAIEKSATATNLFAAAKSQVDLAVGLLEDAMQVDEATIADLQTRIDFTKKHHANNKKVAAKLEEFVV